MTGLEGLRVADSSIMPTMPSANTCASSYMIGEKAADLILGKQPLEAQIIGTRADNLNPRPGSERLSA